MLRLLKGSDTMTAPEERLRVRSADEPVLTVELARAFYVAFQQLRDNRRRAEGQAA